MTGTVLLTGATGFVGRHVLQALVAGGARVRIVVRDGKQAQLSYEEGIEGVVRTKDLFAESVEWWEDVCNDIDTVIHVAWYAEHGKYLQSPQNLDCLAGTLQFAKAAAQCRVRRFVGVGSCFEYDLTGGVQSIGTPLRPLSPYAGAKAAAFMALSQCLPQQGVEFAWCRLFYLYGEGEDARRLVPYLRARLSNGEPAELSKGYQIRDFLDVNEAATMIIETALGKAQGAVNICSGVPITVRQLAERIADEYGRRDLLKFGARPDNLIDPSCIVGTMQKELL